METSNQRNKENRLWSFVNSGLFILIAGFILTGIFGTILSERIQENSWRKRFELEKTRQEFEWKREKKFEIIKRKLDEGQQSLEEISDLISLRFFRLQNTYIFIAQGDLDNATKTWNKYIETVEEWNVKLIINQNKIRRLVSDTAALEFNNYETDNSTIEYPNSIHGKFYVAHKEILNLLNCLKNPGCTLTNEKKQNINRMLRNLDYETDNFIDNISNLFLQRTLEFESLEE